MPTSLRRVLRALIPAVLLALLASGTASAALTGYSETPLTWDVIGVKSNNTGIATGPGEFPVGWRLCNTSGSTKAADTVTFTWGTAGGTGATNISLGSPASQSIPQLAAGACDDIYFQVNVTRNSSSWNATRQFTLATGASGSSTTRQLFVEKLVSQNRNTTVTIAGPGGCGATWITGGALGTCDPAPTNLAVGATYTYKLYAETSTPYEEIEPFITMPGSIFRIQSAHATFQSPATTLTQPWGDGCTWQYAPTTAGSCGSGTVKYGNRVIVEYTATVTAAGSGTLTSLIYDYSGSSFHYNSDYGTGGLSLTVTAAVVPMATLTQTITGTGSVSANSGVIENCETSGSSNCTDTYPQSSSVTLTATPGPGQSFIGWTGDLTGCDTVPPGGTLATSLAISCPMDANRTIDAEFTNLATNPLSVIVTGIGAVSADSGAVSGCTEAGGTGCSDDYVTTATVILTATPDPGQTFLGWDGDLTGCTVYLGPTVITAPQIECPMNQARSITAAFSSNPPAPSTWTLTGEITGTGSISANSGNVQTCAQTGDANCTGTYADGTLVIITATPGPGQELTGWSGDTAGCTPDPPGTALSITCPMDANRTIGATFAPVTYPLTVVVTGTGAVSANTGAIANCTAATGVCSDSYNDGTSVTLTATPGTGQALAGWSGNTSGCTPTPPGTSLTLTCPMDAARTINAAFAPIPYPLTVSVQGPGAVAGSPGAVSNCTASSGTCTDAFAPGTYVTLTATPGAGSTFLGWSGVTCQEVPVVTAARQAASTCIVLMSQAQNAVATFSVPVSVEIIQPPGSSGNKVTAPGVECTGGTCTSSLPPGSKITLTATPGPGQVFLGWGGVCSGTQDTCTITVEQLAQVRASFGAAPQPTLTLRAMPSPIRAGRTTRLLVRWANPTTTATGAATIRVQLPRGLTLVSSNCNVTVSGRTLLIDVADIAATSNGGCSVLLRSVRSRTGSVKGIRGTLTPTAYPNLQASAATGVRILPSLRTPVTG